MKQLGSKNQFKVFTSIILSLILISAYAFAKENNRAINPLPKNLKTCNMDLENPWVLSDIISNALTLGLNFKEDSVRDFMQNIRESGSIKSSEDLMNKTALHFNIESNLLNEAVQQYKFINCESMGKHPPKQSPEQETQYIYVANTQITLPKTTFKQCSVNLENPGEMSDIVSNALNRALHQDSDKVRDFLQSARQNNTFKTGNEMAIAAANQFNINQEAMFAAIEVYKYINCSAQKEEEPGCKINLENPGKMSDIVSNALNREFKKDRVKVRSFLDTAYEQKKFSTGNELAIASAKEFNIDEKALFTAIEKYKYINCWSKSEGKNSDGKISKFAENVIIHVVTHELGHALLREFHLPTLGNEETLADAFATHYIATKMPDRALEILHARVSSLMIEANEVERKNWSVKGEHNSDARRAYQIAAIAIAFDRNKFSSLASLVDMSEKQMTKAQDYGSEVHDSWERILAPLWMANNQTSEKVSVVFNYSIFSQSIQSLEIDQYLKTMIQSFDWPANITLNFKGGKGGASWSRSTRTITIRDQYMHRFNIQGAL